MKNSPQTEQTNAVVRRLVVNTLANTDDFILFMAEMKEPIPPVFSSAPVALSPGLYLVATPIGNLRDITLRALDILGGVDRIACEDTRVTSKLLSAYGLKKSLLIYNDHSGTQDRARLLTFLRDNGRIALVSDAGTPLVSDPGYRLVQECIAENIPVFTIPGANAVLSALQLSALPCDRFSFCGFLPPRSSARRTALEAWTKTPGSLVFYETAPRLAESLYDMAQVLGNRCAAVAREITKRFEETRRGALADLSSFYKENGPPKGEIVVVVGPGFPGEVGEKEEKASALMESALMEALENMTLRDAVDAVSATTGLSRKVVYDRALALRGKKPDEEP